MTTRSQTGIPPGSRAGSTVSDQQWRDYAEQGFLHLGELLSVDELEALRTRADDLALGRVTNSRVEMQLDTGGRYEDLPEATGDFGAGTLLYRKVQGLETDDLYAAVLRRQVFVDIAARHYGPHAPVSLFRAMVMNKPAGQGTVLPWHQDGGDVWALDRDPLVTIWVALDPATVANGCVEVIPGSHRLGLLSAQGSSVSQEDATRHCPADQVHPVEVPAGHAVLMHNWLIHRSGVNPTSQPRRAFTACYMDGRTRNTLTGDHFPMIFGPQSIPSFPFLDHLERERDHFRGAAAASEEYALSLRDENKVLHASVAAATAHAQTLEVEVQRLTGTPAAVPPSVGLGTRVARGVARRIRGRLRR